MIEVPFDMQVCIISYTDLLTLISYLSSCKHNEEKKKIVLQTFLSSSQEPDKIYKKFVKYAPIEMIKCIPSSFAINCDWLPFNYLLFHQSTLYSGGHFEEASYFLNLALQLLPLYKNSDKLYDIWKSTEVFGHDGDEIHPFEEVTIFEPFYHLLLDLLLSRDEQPTSEEDKISFLGMLAYCASFAGVLTRQVEDKLLFCISQYNNLDMYFYECEIRISNTLAAIKSVKIRDYLHTNKYVVGLVGCIRYSSNQIPLLEDAIDRDQSNWYKYNHHLLSQLNPAYLEKIPDAYLIERIIEGDLFLIPYIKEKKQLYPYIPDYGTNRVSLKLHDEFIVQIPPQSHILSTFLV